MMRRRISALAMSGILLAMTACGSSTGSDAADSSVDESGLSAADESASAAAESKADGSSITVDLSDRDYTVSYPEYKDNYDYKEPAEDAEVIDLSEGSVTISEKGYYVLSGTLDGGQVLIDAGDEAVRLYLNGVSIKSDDGPAIYVKSAKNVYISLMDGTSNILSDSSTYTLEAGEDEPNAVVFSKADLIFNGSGTLSVDANYDTAIRSKDDLVFRSGTYAVTSVGDALKGKDLLSVYDGSYTISCEGKALVATNTEDEDCGDIYIEGGVFDISSGDDALHSNSNVLVQGGEFTISSGDDGIHADNICQVYNATIDITKSYEGIEGMIVDITDSDVKLLSSDDGINAAGDISSDDADGAGSWGRGFGGGGFMDGSEDNKIYIDGGSLYVNAAGDGIDSNGYLYILGGDIIVDGPENDGNGFLDYGLDCVMSGGRLIAAGSSGMLQSIGEDSTLTAIVVGLDSTQSAGTNVSITDASGNEIISYAPAKSFNALLFAGYGFEEGATYTATVGGEEAGSVEISAASNTIGEIRGMGGGGMGGGFGGRGMRGGDGEFTPDDMPEGFEPGNMPEGFEPGNMPEGFEPGDMPEGFEPGQRMGGEFTPGELPEGVTPGADGGRGGRGGRGMRGGEQGGNK